MHLWRQHIDDHQLEETHELSPKSIETSMVLLSNIHEGFQTSKHNQEGVITVNYMRINIET